MSSRDPLQCTYDDARRTTLLQGMALDTRAKIDFFEEMVGLAVRFGASDRLAGRHGAQPRVTKTSSPDSTS